MAPSSLSAAALFLGLALLKAERAAGACEDVTFRGYLMDNACWNHYADSNGTQAVFDQTKPGENPEEHTKGCLLMPDPCIKFGYGVLEKTPDLPFGDYTRKYTFDDAGNEEVVEMVTASAKENDFFLHVEGQVCDDAEGVLASKADGPVMAICEPFEVEGYVMDNLCWDKWESDKEPVFDGSKPGINPEAHTKGCLTMDVCIASGFSVLEKLDDGTGYARKLKFDAVGNMHALEQINKSEHEDDIQVKVTGYTCGDSDLASVTSIELVDDHDHDHDHDPKPDDSASPALLAKAARNAAAWASAAAATLAFAPLL